MCCSFVRSEKTTRVTSPMCLGLGLGVSFEQCGSRDGNVSASGHHDGPDWNISPTTDYTLSVGACLHANAEKTATSMACRLLG